MGTIKSSLLDKQPFEDVPMHLVSCHLFKNRLLNKYIHNNGIDGVCHYTGDFTKVLSLRSIVKYIEEIISKYYGTPDNEAVGWDSNFEDTEDTTTFHKELDGYIVPGNLEIYTDIKKLLEDNNFYVDDDRLLNDIVKAFGCITLIKKNPYSISEDEAMVLSWKSFVESSDRIYENGISMKEKCRKLEKYLDKTIEAIYDSKVCILKEDVIELYRCVNYGQMILEEIRFTDLTSPPKKMAKENRMSENGDSCFYGSIDRQTAIEETKHAAGDHVYIGLFKSVHKLCLLDLTGIKERLSIFDQKYDKYFAFIFLNQFAKEISKPIDGEISRYAPTQLLTYYLRNEISFSQNGNKPISLDGILYKSCFTEKTNAVLFFDNEESAKHLRLMESELINREYYNSLFTLE